MPPDKDPAAPADGNAGNLNPQASDPGREPDAHETPEQDAETLQTESREGEEKGQRPDGEPAPDAAANTEPKPSEPPRRKPRSQQRIEQLTAQVGDLQRQVEHFRALAEKSGPPRKLDPLAFASDADYQRALIAETARQSQTEFAKTQAQAAASQAALVEQQIWDARVADYREEVPDFDAVAYSAAVPYSKHGMTMVRQLPEGAQVAYWLGKNVAEAQRIANLTPLETAFELGRIAQRLKGPPRKVVSQAPNPVPTVRARGAATGFQPDSDDIDGYFAWRDKLQ